MSAPVLNITFSHVVAAINEGNSASSGTSIANLVANGSITDADLPTAQLLQPGSRANRALLFAGERDRVESFKAWLQKNKQRGQRLQGRDAVGAQRRSAGRAGTAAAFVQGDHGRSSMR